MAAYCGPEGGEGSAERARAGLLVSLHGLFRIYAGDVESVLTPKGVVGVLAGWPIGELIPDVVQVTIRNYANAARCDGNAPLGNAADGTENDFIVLLTGLDKPMRHSVSMDDILTPETEEIDNGMNDYIIPAINIDAVATRAAANVLRARHSQQANADSIYNEYPYLRGYRDGVRQAMHKPSKKDTD